MAPPATQGHDLHSCYITLMVQPELIAAGVDVGEAGKRRTCSSLVAKSRSFTVRVGWRGCDYCLGSRADAPDPCSRPWPRRMTSNW